MSVDFNKSYDEFNDKISSLDKEQKNESDDFQDLFTEAIALTQQGTEKEQLKKLSELADRIQDLSESLPENFKRLKDISELWKCCYRLVQSPQIPNITYTLQAIHEDVQNGLENLEGDLHIAKHAILRSNASFQIDQLLNSLKPVKKELAVTYLSKFDEEKRSVILDFASANCKDGEDLLNFLEFAYSHDGVAP